jgi:hypothetical protein
MAAHYSPEMVAKLLTTFEELLTKLDFANEKVFGFESKVNNFGFSASKKWKGDSLAWKIPIL